MSGEADFEGSTVQDDVAFLAGDEKDDNTPDETPETEVETQVEAPEQQETETETPSQSEDKALPTPASVLAKTVSEKYPEIWKEFPDLRKALFEANYYQEIFPTRELAKEAAEKVSHFETLGSDLITGEIGTLLDSIYDIEGEGPKAVAKIVEKFLPTVFSRSEALWRKAVDPVFRNTLNEMRNQARQEKNKNLWLTAQNLSQWLYGVKDAMPEQKTAPDPEKEELKNKLGSLKQREESIFFNAAQNEIYSTLAKEISSKIDASVPAELRDLIVEKAYREIGTILRQNKQVTDLINRIGEAARRSGLRQEDKVALIQAYVKPARALINQALAKVAPKFNGESPEPRKNPGQGAPARGNKPIDPKKIDWNKTSDRDFLAGKVTTK